MNFMGLGVTFGAKDAGLLNALGAIEGRLGGIHGSLIDMNAMQAASNIGAGIVDGLAPDKLGDAGEALDGLTGQLGDDVPDAAGEAAKGLGRGTDKMRSSLFGARTGMHLFGGAVIDVGDLVGGLLRPFTAAASAAGSFVASFSPSALAANNQAMNSSMNLMSDMESSMHSNSIEARRMGANFGYTGSELDRFSNQAASMAYSLDVGTDTAAKAIRGFTEAETELRAVGITSANDLARFTEAFGVDADVLRNSTMQMTREFGFSEEQIHQTLSSMVAMGQNTGDVAGAINDLGANMDLVRTRAALMGTELDPAVLADMTIQTQALAAGLFQVGQSSDQVRGASQEIAQAMVGAQAEFQNMFSGTQEMLPDWIKAVATATGDSDAAFEAMSQGPAGFMESMTRAVAQLRGSGADMSQQLNFVRSHFSEAFGDDIANQMVNFFERADDATLATMDSVRGATRDLGALGREAHRASFTLEDRFTRAMDGMDTQLRSIARSDVRSFIADVGRKTQEWGGIMQQAAADGGPMGDLLQTLSLSGQLGGYALIPEQLRGTAAAAGQMNERVNDLWTAFDASGGVTGGVVRAFSLITARATELRHASRGSEEGQLSWGDSAREAAKQVISAYSGVLSTAGTFLTDLAQKFLTFDWVEMFSGGADSPLDGIFDGVAAGTDWGGIAEDFSKGYDRLWNALKPYMDAAWNTARDWLQEGAGETFDALWNWSKPRVVEGLQKMGPPMMEGLGTAFDALWNWSKPRVVEGLKKMGPAMMEGLGIAFDALWNWSRDAMESWIMTLDPYESFKTMMQVSAVPALAAGILLALQAMATAISGWVLGGGILTALVAMSSGVLAFLTGTLVPGILAMLGAAASAIGAVLASPFLAIVAVIVGVALAIAAVWYLFEEDIRAGWTVLSTHFSEKMDEIAAYFTESWTVLTTYASEKWAEFIAQFSEGWAGIKGSVGLALGWIQEKWEGFKTSMAEGLTGMVGMLTAPFRAVAGVIGPVVDTITAPFDRIREAGSAAFEGVMGTVDELFGNSVNTVVGEDMEETIAVVTAATDQIAAHFEDVLFGSTVRALTSGFLRAFEAIEDAAGGFGQALIESMEHVALAIHHIFHDMYTALAHGAIASSLIIEEGMGQVVQRLRALTAAQERFDAARNNVSSPEATPEAEERRQEQLSRMSADLQAIHNPMWWSASGGYKEVFERRMQQLIQATASASGGGGSPVDTDRLERLLVTLEGRGPQRRAGSRGSRRSMGTNPPGNGGTGDRRSTT